MCGYHDGLCIVSLMQNDHVDGKRECKIGKIEVIRYETAYSHQEMHLANYSSAKIDFTQANKKDVNKVTKNGYCMATTRQGKLVHKEKPYSRPNPHTKESVHIWNIGDELDKLHIEYHMTQTLLDWGIQPVRTNWSQPGNAASTSSFNSQEQTSHQFNNKTSSITNCTLL